MTYQQKQKWKKKTTEIGNNTVEKKIGAMIEGEWKKGKKIYQFLSLIS